MIKFYNSLKIITCIFLLGFGVGSAFGQVFITEIADPNNNASARYVELYNSGGSSFDLAASNYALLRYTNGNTTPQSPVALTGTIAAGGFYVIAANGTAYNTAYSLTADQDIGTGGPADSNGDDQILLIDNTDPLNPITIDIFGVIGEDGSGTAHEFEDGRAERKGFVSAGNTTWTASEWNIDNDSGGGDGPIDAPAGFDPGAWIGPDLTAPSFINSTPNVSNLTENGFDLNVELDEEATAYFVVLSDGATAPNASEIEAGTGSGGASAEFSGSVTVLGSTFTAETISSLVASTAYDVYVFAKDLANNATSVQTKIDVSTTADQAPFLTASESEAASTTNTFTLTFSENVTTTDETGFSLTIDGVTATITNVTGSGTSTLTFTISETIAKNSGALLVSYNDASGNVQDGTANSLASFTDVTVVNNTTTNVVGNLTEARALSSGESVRISGEVLVTYVTGNSRNQIFIQDSGAGILIDDSSGTIVTSLSEGDGVTDLEGTLGAFGGVTQLVPDVDPGATSSTGNTITPLIVTIADFNAAVDTYESRLLVIENVNYTNADGALTFTDPTSDYSDVSDGVNTTTFDADGFLNIDYSADIIPYGQLDLIVLGRENNGTPIVTARSSSDIQDSYAPLFIIDPATSNVTTNSFDVTFQADEQGTYYYVVDQNATAPDAATIISTGTSLAYTDVATNVTFNVSGLNDNTQYYVHTVLADDETTPNEQSVATTTTATTLEIVFDADSDILAPTSQIAAGSVSSLANDAGSAVGVFTFTLSDLGTADGEPTLVNTIVIEKGTNNTVADWSSVIAGASLFDGSADITVTNTIVNTDNITFDLVGNEYSLGDGASVDMTLSIYLNTNVVDEEVLAFEIPISHSFQADVAGSVFVADIASAITSNDQTIEVDATELSLTAPSSAVVNTDFSVSFEAVDANGNLDLASRTMEISLASGTGTLSSVVGLTQDVFDGTFTWTDLQYNVIEDITLLVDDQGSALMANTNTISISDVATGTLFFSEYIEGSSNNKALEIFNATGAQVDLSEYRILRDNNGTTDATDTLELSDIAANLAAEGILVIANPSADAAILSVADITSEITFYNGDDALRLMKGSETIDQIGELGVDPGTNWEVAGGPTVTGGGATSEYTLVRKSGITEGNPNALGSFGSDPDDSEWIVLPADDFSNLGVFDGATTPNPFIGLNISSFNGNFGFVEFGTDSDVRSYLVEGADLSSDITITPPASFEISTTSDFSSSIGTNASPLVLTQSTGVVASTDIFVRFVPDAADGTTDSGDIIHTSDGATDKSVTVEGTEGAATITEILTARGLAVDTEVTVQGIVTTPDFGFGNDQYFIQDATAGINIFNGADAGVNIGDEVEITGNLDSFGDQVQISATIVTVLSTGNDLPASQTITTTDLAVDNDLQGSRVTISGVVLVDETQWPTEAIDTGSGITVDAMVDGTTFGIRIDRGESFYDGSPVPSQPFVLTGILSRFNEDVQIMPFVDGDIAEETAGITLDQAGFNGDFGAVQIGTSSTVSSYIVSASGLSEDMTLTVAGEFEVSLTEDFSALVGDASTPLTIENTQGDVEPTLVYVRFSPTVAGAATGSITHSSTGVDSQVIDLSGEGTEDEVTSVDPRVIRQGIKLFPNPVNNGNLTIELSEELGEVEVKLMTLTGSALQATTTLGTTTLKVGGLKSGVYMLQLSNEDFTQNYRVILK